MDEVTDGRRVVQASEILEVSSLKGMPTLSEPRSAGMSWRSEMLCSKFRGLKKKRYDCLRTVERKASDKNLSVKKFIYLDDAKLTAC